MSEKVNVSEKLAAGLAPLSEDDLDTVAGGRKTYWKITDNAGCGGSFITDVDNPPYCVLCGAPIYWG